MKRKYIIFASLSLIAIGTIIPLYLLSLPKPPTTSTPSQNQQTTIERVVASKESNVYHKPSCRYAEKIKSENKIWFDSPAEARAAGYRPCEVCNPG